MNMVNAISVYEPPQTCQTREEWLTRLINVLRSRFEQIGHPIPVQLRVTCGWPSKAALGRHQRRVGECWSPKASADQTTEIFISPSLGEAIEAAKTLVHELVHAGGARGHRRSFSRVAKAIGLRRPWTSTSASPELTERLNALISEIGPYPHAQLGRPMFPSPESPEEREDLDDIENPKELEETEENDLCGPARKDTTRMHKVVCASCGYTVRTSAKWIATGLPTCPCGTRMEAALEIIAISHRERGRLTFSRAERSRAGAAIPGEPTSSRMSIEISDKQRGAFRNDL